MATQWTVTTTSGIWVRENHSVSAKAIRVLPKGSQFMEIDVWKSGKEYWVKHSEGWSCGITSSGTTLAIAREASTPNVKPAESNPAAADVVDDGSGYRPNVADLNIFGTTASTTYDRDYATIDNALGILGLPYQWLPNADPRIDGSDSYGAMGEVYAEEIVGNMPLLLLTPGKASFMTKYSQNEKKNILEQILTSGAGNSNSLSDLISREGRYYTFEATTKDFYKVFNPMARIGARYMGVQDETINGVPLDRMNWEDYFQTRVTKFADVGTMGAIPFYINSETSISESFSNSTTESSLSGMVNSISDMGRELNFLMGYSANANAINAMQDQDINKNIENVQNAISGMLGKNNFINSLAGHLTTVASGGRLTFPEIWSDSSYGKSYDVTCRYVSPDNDKLSLFLNILLPIFAHVALVAPQSLANNPNGYMAPFLVRAVYKGLFCIDTGIITSMNINKGAEGLWTPDGIPTQVEISMTIKDLYQVLSVTSTELTDIKYSTLNNTALMDFIATSCGVNIFQPEIARTIDMWLVNTLQTKIQDLVKVDIWQGIKDKFSNLIMGLYRSY